MTTSARPAFRYERRVEFSDTDMAGIVHFASFFYYMEAAEHSFLRSLDLPVFMSEEDGVRLSWPRVAVKCDYHSPARFGDVLAIDVSIAALKSKAITYRFDISIANRRIATGETTAVCCQMLDDHSLKSVDIPASVRAKLI